jgi:hypothetical protein
MSFYFPPVLKCSGSPKRQVISTKQNRPILEVERQTSMSVKKSYKYPFDVPKCQCKEKQVSYTNSIS